MAVVPPGGHPDRRSPGLLGSAPPSLLHRQQQRRRPEHRRQPQRPPAGVRPRARASRRNRGCADLLCDSQRHSAPGRGGAQRGWPRPRARLCERRAAIAPRTRHDPTHPPFASAPGGAGGKHVCDRGQRWNCRARGLCRFTYERVANAARRACDSGRHCRLVLAARRDARLDRGAVAQDHAPAGFVPTRVRRTAVLLGPVSGRSTPSRLLFGAAIRPQRGREPTAGSWADARRVRLGRPLGGYDGCVRLPG